jgi:CheY-like chemotaxis protein
VACVLFVDDDPYTLEMLDKSVQILGHKALLANSGKEALELAATGSPDLIVTDMRLPDMDGLALLSQLKQGFATAQIPVVILSAGPELDAVKMSQAAGAGDYLEKPIRLQTLQEAIERFTSG